MKLCRCHVCEKVEDVEPGPSSYGQTQTPPGWALVSLVRQRKITPPVREPQTMSVDAGPLGEVAITTEREEAAALNVTVLSELQLCPVCVDRLVAHPILSKRIAEDDTRVSAALCEAFHPQPCPLHPRGGGK